MARVDIFKVDKDVSKYIHWGIGIVMIILGLLLLVEYFIHFLKIVVGVIAITYGLYFIANQKRFKWFRLRF